MPKLRLPPFRLPSIKVDVTPKTPRVLRLARVFALSCALFAGLLVSEDYLRSDDGVLTLYILTCIFGFTAIGLLAWAYHWVGGSKHRRRA